MLFNSHLFLFGFLPCALAGYYATAYLLGARACKVWLGGASLVFYSWWHPAFLLLLLGSIAFNYAISLHLRGDDSHGGREDLVLICGISANVLLLFYYKYLFPLLDFLHRLGWLSHDSGSVLLPLGISFFTFTQIGYLVDCRQGQIRERGLLDYLLFVTFFPHLVAGPILHHSEIMPQFARRETYRFRPENMAVGLTLFTVGLAKKVLLADSIASWVDSGFSNAGQLRIWDAWSVALGYSMQLYFDFSGYSDMAIGLGILFAIRLPLNFNSPYQARSIIEFWQRWHMTLTRYLTLLLYNPLAVWVTRMRQQAGLPLGRRAVTTPGGFMSLIVFPTFVTVLIAGIWHGAGITYIAYGALHGVYLCINHFWRTAHGLSDQAPASAWSARWATVWRILLTYLAVLLAQLVFRAPTLGHAVALLGDLSGAHPNGHLLPQTFDMCIRVLGLGVIAFCIPNIYRFLGPHSPSLTSVRPLRWQALMWRPSWQLATLTGALLAAAILFCYRETPFLYFQF